MFGYWFTTYFDTGSGITHQDYCTPTSAWRPGCGRCWFPCNPLPCYAICEGSKAPPQRAEPPLLKGMVGTPWRPSLTPAAQLQAMWCLTWGRSSDIEGNMQKSTQQMGVRTHFCKETSPQVLSQLLACAQAEGSPNTYLPSPQ